MQLVKAFDYLVIQNILIIRMSSDDVIPGHTET